MQSGVTLRLYGFAAVAAGALALGGCMGDRMTYGTGTPPGRQTLEDIGGLVSLGGNKQKPIVRYQPRPKVVAPPQVAALPAPESASADELANANWPKDPDEAKNARARAKLNKGTSLLPSDNPDVEVSGLPLSGKGDLRAMKVKPEDQAILDRENAEKADKIRAEIKAGESGVDANGNRVRKTLTEPPTAYREPDPGAPMEFKVTKKKFRWPWQKGDPNSAPEHLENANQQP
jgi:hypothetical protein